MAVADGAIAGFASWLATGDAIEIEDLFVDPERMRRGIGSALGTRPGDAGAQARGPAGGGGSEPGSAGRDRPVRAGLVKLAGDRVGGAHPPRVGHQLPQALGVHLR